MSKVVCTLIGCLLSLLLIAPVRAESLVLPAGLELELPEELDLTYQIFPNYDENEKVIVGWEGEKAQFFTHVTKLPPEYLDAKSYITALALDLRAAWGGIELGKQATYKTDSGMSVTVVVLSKPASGDSKKADLISHFITNGRVAFVATATALNTAPVEQVFDDTVELLRTVKLPAPGVVIPKSESREREDSLVGNWVGEDKLPDGRTLVAKIQLKHDSFAVEARAGDQVILSATGYWWLTDNAIYWTYLYSKPELPEAARKDEDELISVDASSLVLKSKLSGKQRVFRRAD